MPETSPGMVRIRIWNGFLLGLTQLVYWRGIPRGKYIPTARG